MKIAYFDCFSGISGDMFLGSLIHAGLDPDALVRELCKLPLEGWRLHVHQTKRHAIAATRVEVHAEHGSHSPDSANAHPPTHAHEHEHPHEHPHEHERPHGHRGLAEILEIIRRSELDGAIKSDAERIFRRLADAESAAHRVPTDEIHFHEVGAIDAIIDIVGAAIAIHLLEIHEVHASPLPVGRGFVRCDHGLMPIPAPGTMELLKGVPVVPSTIDRELVTPTGAAIITTFAQGFGPMPEMVVETIGYGAGARDLKEQPNMLRVVLGAKIDGADATPLMVDRIGILETNIDDQSPETFGYLVDRLLAAGALDAYFTPIVMKKGRPAYQLSVLAESERVESLAALILRETTTFGVRTWEASRRKLAREFHAVETPYGTVTVKVGHMPGVHKVAPEFDDCRRLAEAASVPIRDVYEAALHAYERTRARKDETE